MDKLSYALGLSMGHNFIHSGVKQIVADDFAAALKAVYDNEKPEMTFEEAQKIVNDFFINLRDEQMKMNRELGKKFLEENGKQEGVTTTPSGLQYKVIKAGSGMPPKVNDKVTVHYTGRLIDGTVFDSSVERGEPATFALNQVIPGWTEALQLMNEGAEWQLVIPAELAYGSHGAGDVILPDSTLVFDVKLIKVERQSGLIL